MAAHPGIGKTKALIGRCFHWKNLGQVKTFVENCKCVRSKARRDKTPGFLVPLPIPERPQPVSSMRRAINSITCKKRFIQTGGTYCRGVL